MSNKDKVVLKKIIAYCNDVDTLNERYARSFLAFKNDIAFQYSVNMCIIQIGELVSRLSNELKDQYSEIPWSEIRAMRNIHAHDYENVDLSIVWHTINEEIPALREQIRKIME